MSNFPDSVLVPKQYRDKGESVTELGKLVDVNNHIVLSNYAKRREVTTDGRVLSSTISVTYNSEAYTEVFSTPVPVGNYFYSYDDTTAAATVLLFNAAQSKSLPLRVDYTTRGDIITAARATQVETDLAAVENALGAKTAVLQTGIIPAAAGAVQVAIDTTRIDLVEIASIIVLVSADDGTSGHSFSYTLGDAYVTVVSNSSDVHYLFVIAKS